MTKNGEPNSLPTVQEDEIEAAIKSALEKMRGSIDTIDRKIVDLLAARQEEVKKILALKKAHSLSVYHPAREENLISRLRTQSLEKDLDPDFLEDLYRRILKQSRAEQTASIARVGVRPGADVLIIGGKGEMGKYLDQWFTRAGYQVRILERSDWPQAGILCRDIQVAIISVPIDITCDIAAKIGPLLPADCILADVTSIKQKPLDAMLQAHKGPVVGLHPMFGPTTSTLDKQIVIVTPGRDAEKVQWLLDQFIAWGTVLVKADAAEHDEIMNIVQSIRHFATFAFGQFLRRRRVNLARTLEFSSPIYRLELGMVGRLFAQDPALYAEIIFASSERQALLKEFVASLKDNLPMLERGDKKAFNKEFRKIAEWFGPFSDQALRESTYLIDKLIERF
jgi:chorismate mutase/prephenate dehydrogenase